MYAPHRPLHHTQLGVGCMGKVAALLEVPPKLAWSRSGHWRPVLRHVPDMTITRVCMPHVALSTTHSSSQAAREKLAGFHPKLVWSRSGCWTPMLWQVISITIISVRQSTGLPSAVLDQASLGGTSRSAAPSAWRPTPSCVCRIGAWIIQIRGT
jgi:hypothetical protein